MASGGGAALTQLQQPVATPEPLYPAVYAELTRIVRADPTANGLAIIIANRYGSQRQQKPLAGVEKDFVKMTETFTKLKYAIYGRRDASREELLAMLEAVATFKFTPGSPYRRIVFIFSGHGYIAGRTVSPVDNICTHTGDVQIAGIVARLQPCSAPDLARLPKLYFIDACRGALTMQGVVVPRGGEDVITKIVAPYGNYLVAYSTMRSFQAYEAPEEGGVWITLLARKLLEVRKSIGDVLVAVNGELDRLYQSPHRSRFLQQPICESTLKEPVNFLAEADPSEDEEALPNQPPVTHHLLEGDPSPIMGALCAKPDRSQESLLPVVESSFFQGGLQNVNGHTVHNDHQGDSLQLQAVDYGTRPTHPIINWQHIQSPLPNSAAPTMVVDQSPLLHGPPKRSYSTDEDGTSPSRAPKVTSWHEKKSHSTEEGSLSSHYRNHNIFSGPLGLQSTGSHAYGSVQQSLGLSSSMSDPGPSHSEQLLEKYKRDNWIESYRCTVQSVEDHSSPELALFKATVTLSLPGNTELELCSEDAAPYIARERAKEKAVQLIKDSVSDADEIEFDRDVVTEADHGVVTEADHGVVTEAANHAGHTEEAVAAKEQIDHSPPQAGCKSDIINRRKQFNEWCQQNSIAPVRDHKTSTLGQHQYTITYITSGLAQSFVSGYHSRKKDAEEEASSRAVEHERLKRACDSLGKTPKKLLQEFCDKSRLLGVDFRPVLVSSVPQAMGPWFQSEVVIRGTENEAVAGDLFQTKGAAEHSAALRALHKFGIL